MSFFGSFKKSGPDIEKMKREGDVNGLINALEYTEDEGIQTSATDALGNMGDRAIGPLCTALGHSSSEIRYYAAEALGIIRDPRSVAPLIGILHDPDDDVRCSAVEALGKIGDPRAVEPLLQMLRDPNGEVQKQVALALGQIGDPRAIEPLIRLCRRGKWEDSLGIPIAALSLMGAPVVWPCIHALGHSNEYVRLSAQTVLGKVEEISIAPLHIALNHPDSDVRSRVAEALAFLADPLIDKGQVLASQKHWIDARTCFDRALAIDPNNARALNNKATAGYATAETLTWAAPVAFEYLRKAIRIDPDNQTFKENYSVIRSLLPLVNRAQIHQDDGDLDNAMRLWKEREMDCRNVENHDGVQGALGNQAVILQIRGDLDEAMALLKEQERISRELGFHHGIQSSLGNQALILRQRGDQEGAATLFREQERICRETENTESLHHSFGEKGKRLLTAGDSEGALPLFREQERICQEFGYSDGLIQSLASQASILEARGDLEAALGLLEQQGRIFVELNRIPDLLQILNHQEKLSRDLGDEGSLYLTLWNQSVLLLQIGDLEGAEKILKKEEQLCRKLGKTDDLIQSLITRARIQMLRGDRDGAMSIVRDVEKIVPEPEKIRRLTATLDDPTVVGEWRYGSSAFLEKTPDEIKGEQKYTCSQCKKPIRPGFSYDFESHVLEAVSIGSHCSECGDVRCKDHVGDGRCQQCGGRTYTMLDTPPDTDSVRLYLSYAMNLRTGEIVSEHYNQFIRPPYERAC